MQILNVLYDLLETGRNGKAAAIRTTPEEQIEVGNPLLVALGKITLGHGQFIKIAEHGQIQLFVNNHIRHLVIDLLLLYGNMAHFATPFSERGVILSLEKIKHYSLHNTLPSGKNVVNYNVLCNIGGHL